MKIGPFEAKNPVAPASTERKTAGLPMPPTAEAAQVANTAKTAEPSAKVALSPAAALLSGQAAEATFDAQKVERIAQAIRDGKFTINAEAIADKLIVNAQELLGRKPN